MRVSSRGGIICTHGGDSQCKEKPVSDSFIVYIIKLLGSSVPSKNTRQFIFLFKLSNFYFHVSAHLIGFLDGSVVKNLPANAGGMGSTPGLERSPRKENTHSSILSLEVPWTEEPGGLHSPGGGKESDLT